jgi:hypothetical protein
LFLSKSKYVVELQCPKALWIHYNDKALLPETDAGTAALFDQGHEVGLFYCGSAEVRRKIESKLRRRLKGCSIDATRPPEYGEFYIVVKARSHVFNNDCDWFYNVFRKLGVTLSE